MTITAEYCRICLKYSSVFNEEANAFESFSIYKKDDNNVCFADKLEYLTKINIPRNIPLAKRICKSCSAKLNSSYDLVKECENSEEVIQNFINENMYADQFKNLLQDEMEFKTQIKIEAVVLEDNPEMFEDINENMEMYDSNDLQNDDDLWEDDDDLEEIENVLQVKKRKYESDSDNDDEKDTDFVFDELAEALSENDEYDSDYAPKPRKPTPKKNISRSLVQTKLKADPNTRIIKLNLIRGSRTNIKQSYDHENKPKILMRMNRAKIIKPGQGIKLRPAYQPKIKPCKEKKEKKKIFLKTKDPNTVSTKSTICPICGKIYQTEETMRGHIKWHENNEECFKCEVCGKGFDNPSYLRSHKRIHSKRSTPYRCEICGKSFFHPNKLRLHTKYFHTEERIKCPHCDVTVKYPSSLKRHLFTHTEVKNYECIDCSKPFRSRSNLNQHLESKFHSSKEIQPMIRIKGIAQQYVPGPPKPSYTKKRKSQKKKDSSEDEMKIQSNQTAHEMKIQQEQSEKEDSTSENYTVNDVEEVPNLKN